MQHSSKRDVGSNQATAQLKIASITIGTNEGLSTLYARSRSSIHQHAMTVSLRTANKRTSSPPTATERPRAELMNRFRAKSKPTKKRDMIRKPLRQGAVAEPLSDDAENVVSAQLVRAPPLFPRHPNHYSMSETGLEAGSLNRIRESCKSGNIASWYLTSAVERSLFGQDPYIVNPERSALQYALHDHALFNGILALACLGRDLDQEMKASRLCLKLKGQTIRAVRHRLSEDPSNISIGTIGAIAALAAFDLVECLGRPEPRPDNMNFLQMAVSRKGGLHGLIKEEEDSCGRCSMLKRIVLWLDLSFAVMDETPTLFAFHDAPIHLASTALHTVSLHMTPLRTVFAELSELSRSADETLSNDIKGQGAGRIWAGDPVAGMEQYVTALRANEIAPEVLEILRLATFLYSARYIRRFSSNSRMQMQLAIRLQTCLAARFGADFNIRHVGTVFQLADSYQGSLHRAVVLWSATVGAVSSGSFKEICWGDHQERRSFWTKMLSKLLRSFELTTVTEVEVVLGDLTQDTIACRRERRLLLDACGIPED